jgi:hypothetical protein
MDFENFDVLSLETSFVDILDPFKGILEDPLTEFLTEFPSSLKFERTDRLDLANDLRKHAFVLCDDEMLSPTVKRQKKIIRNRKEAWEFILTWSEEAFYRQFRLPKEDFLILVEKCKSIYPGKSKHGIENYKFAQRMGQVSTPNSGPITMEIKLAVTLRLLAGASYLDMIWYGVQLDSVHPIFIFTLDLVDKALPNKDIFNFDPSNSNFSTECQRITNE